MPDRCRLEVDMSCEQVWSYDLTKAKPYVIGLVGQGPALEALSRLFEFKGFHAAFPGVELAGWAPLSEQPVADVPTLLRDKPVFPDIQAMAAARPDMTLVIDLSSGSLHMKAIHEAVTPQMSISTADSLLRFCAAAHDGRLAIGGGESLRKSQKIFALLVDQLDGDMLILDGEGYVLDINHHAAESRGLTREEIIGRHCEELDIDQRFCFNDEETCPYYAARQTGKQAQHTFDQTTESGRVRYVLALCFPVADAFGGPTQYLYIRRDVTENQRLEKLLEQKEKDAALGKLTLYLAHEIRNPLFAIGGFANALLRNASLNDLAREKARIIYDESRRLDVILAKILNFAKATEQILGEFEPENVVRQALELMNLSGGESGVTVEVRIESHLPMVRGNADNVKDCLHNMIKNAMEAMPDGGTLSLDVKRSEAYVRIDVKDTGRGIPQDLQEQVFNPFFSTKEGMGLGLGMTRKLIEEMGGKVLLESQPGVGTRISMLIPVALATDKDEKDAPVLGSLQSELENTENERGSDPLQ